MSPTIIGFAVAYAVAILGLLHKSKGKALDLVGILIALGLTVGLAIGIFGEVRSESRAEQNRREDIARITRIQEQGEQSRQILEVLSETVSALAQQESNAEEKSKLENLSQRIKQAAPAETWFVYLTTDKDADRKAVTLRNAERITKELRRKNIMLPVRVYATDDDSLWAVGVGDPVPLAQAQEMINVLVQSGFSGASRNQMHGWRIIQ
jgi:hypothetical protein